jgi:hypothetical protein
MKNRIYFINFKSGEHPSSLASSFGVRANNTEELSEALSKETKFESSVLFIDSMDLSEHQTNARVTIDGYTYYADIDFFAIIND